LQRYTTAERREHTLRRLELEMLETDQLAAHVNLLLEADGDVQRDLEVGVFTLTWR
jgi:hypothetical protein